MSVFLYTAVNAKPRCQSFNNYDNKVTIIFIDDNARKRYEVTDARIIPSWCGKEYPAKSVKVNVKNGVAEVTLIFPHITQFSDPKVKLRINGKKTHFKVCQ